MHFIYYAIILALLIGCSNLQPQSEKLDRQCASLLVDVEIIDCFNQASSDIIARRISTTTRRLTDGDWPHSFQMLLQLKVEKTGRFQLVSVLRSTNSRMLDKKIIQAINSVEKIFVPQNDLFNTAEYSRLKLLVKPARTPLLGNEQLVDSDALVVYINKIRR